MRTNNYIFVFVFLMMGCYQDLKAQRSGKNWIRPKSAKSEAMWGIRNGIVFSIWPAGVENDRDNTGGPRGLIRVGYENKGTVYLINFLAIEPVVGGTIEYSEISPSLIDNQWGKLMWAGESKTDTAYFGGAKTRGAILHPDSRHPEVEELSVYIFMERFNNGAHPYFRLFIRSDNPEELGIEVFNHSSSAPMERCVVTATMGNYSRLRNLHLIDKVIKSTELYKGYEGIGFTEKESYPLSKLWKASNGDVLVVAESDEDVNSLNAWPQEKNYLDRAGWRYRPNIKLSQYWRKAASDYDSSLMLRVNGRAKYWSGGSINKEDYIDIPGGPSFENFELRERYHFAEKVYFGITKKSARQFL
ncbi:hypothetical protein ASE74_04570 [Pedobacter sp. Leaf216]|uniref:hypothetical protein n=1 Tax=Pedobacter sp. Leaf216 TaxID=1735684 RepID=UPI000700E962|nr:hypothetical protein [Pedobacter sp. Leaf216]KQM69292.1 hypothetical protein ASE74_04570 [Pedobacter sp. Leaf216]